MRRCNRNGGEGRFQRHTAFFHSTWGTLTCRNLILVAEVKLGTGRGTTETPAVTCSNRDYTNVRVYIVTRYLCSRCLDFSATSPQSLGRTDGVFWTHELGPEQRNATPPHGHCRRSAGCSAWKGSLPGLPRQAICFIAGWLPSRLLRSFIAS